MNWAKTRIALAAAAALGLGACQTPGFVVVEDNPPPYPEQGYPVPEAPAFAPVEGRWVDDRGGFTAVFDRGGFYSRSTRTGQVLTEGSYRVRRGEVRLDWVSLTSRQHRSASCNFAGPHRLICYQPGTDGFSLTRA